MSPDPDPLGSPAADPAAGSAPRYRERLRAPLRWWVQGTLLVVSLWLAVIVALPTTSAWAVTGLGAAVMVVLLVTWGSAEIRVDASGLRAGRAHLEPEFLGRVTAWDQDASRLRAGARADARAFLVLRPWLKESVEVEVTDPADPTPYWLISTRRPAQVAAALAALGARPVEAADRTDIVDSGLPPQTPAIDEVQED